MQNEDFFRDICVALDSWVASATNAVIDETSDLIWVENAELYRRMQNTLGAADIEYQDIQEIFSECFRGLLVSILTILDGGTALAEKGRLYLTDENGSKLGEGLHEKFVSYLIDTGRLK